MGIYFPGLLQEVELKVCSGTWWVLSEELTARKNPGSSLFLCSISVFGVSLMNVTASLPAGCTSLCPACTLSRVAFLLAFTQAKPL